MKTIARTQKTISGRKTFRFSRCRTFCGMVGLALFYLATPALQAADIVWIEEHWQLSIGAPDTQSSAPQVSMLMSPFSNLDNDFFVFTLNHHSHPGYVPGGMQIQHWNEDGATAYTGPKEGCLSTNSEVVSWVQRLSVDEGSLTFEILNGHSETWESFGGNGHLRSSTPTSLLNLNQYDPGLSTNESGVNFAGNRVSSLVLTRLRWATSDGQTYEMQAPIDVDTDLLDP